MEATRAGSLYSKRKMWPMGTVVPLPILWALSWDQEGCQASSLWNLSPLGKKVRLSSCGILLLPCSLATTDEPWWCPELEEGGCCMQGVREDLCSRGSSLRPSSASSPTGSPRCWDPIGKRAGKVLGGDLLKEPRKHIKEKQSPDRVGTRQPQRHRIAERVSSAAFLPLALDGPCARGPGTLEGSRVSVRLDPAWRGKPGYLGHQ